MDSRDGRSEFDPNSGPLIGPFKPCLNLKRKVKFQDMMPEQLKQVAIKFYRLGKRNQLQPACCFSKSLMSFQESNRNEA